MYLYSTFGNAYGYSYSYPCVQTTYVPNREKFVCQSSSCYTRNGKACVFPFKYAGRIYNQCIDLLNGGTPWCSTKVDSNGQHTSGFWDNCQETCPLNNCPVGYVRSFPDTTCYRVASFKEKVESFDEAEGICQNEGARLWQPRVLESVDRILDLEQDLLTYDAYYAIGMRKEFGTIQKTYPNGEPVEQEFSKRLQWQQEYQVQNDYGQNLCIVLYRRRFQMVSCNGHNSSSTPLYFICEARPMDDIDDGGTCHFPFSYNSETFSSCTNYKNKEMSKLPVCKLVLEHTLD